MFEQELPLVFPDEADVIKVSEAMYDPFEYLMLRHKKGRLEQGFKQPLGKVSYDPKPPDHPMALLRKAYDI